MNEFVEECRREWKRLGVPDPVADEMAAELEADLEEAEAEGVSAEEVLGSGAFDPRSFAAAWAAERGVVQRTPPNEHGLSRRFQMVAAIGVFALIAVIGGVLVIVASPSGPTRLALTADVGPPAPGLGPVVVSPDGRTIAYLAPAFVRMPSPPPGELRIAAPRPAPATRIVAVDISDSGMDTRTVGWILLTMGLGGVVPSTMFLLWVGPGPWSRRRTHIDDRPTGPAS